MDVVAEVQPNSPVVTGGNGRGRVQVLTRQHLDGRSKARKQFDAIASGIAKDLGGDLSTVQLHLVEAFAGIALAVGAANARLLLGEAVDIAEHSQTVSTLVRVASRIGLGRVAKDITDPLSYARERGSESDEASP
jgi:hypothetical protein